MVVDDVSTERAERFYSAAYSRIVRMMLVLGLVLSVAAVFRYGVSIGVGFVFGCVIGIVNFHWLKRGVSGLADRLTESGHKPGSAGVVMRFLLRYLLVAAGAYAIFRVSRTSLYGLLAGLFLPVAAIMIEAVYEVYVAVRRGV